jgi:hypothetical protein
LKEREVEKAGLKEKEASDSDKDGGIGKEPQGQDRVFQGAAVE